MSAATPLSPIGSRSEGDEARYDLLMYVAGYVLGDIMMKGTEHGHKHLLDLIERASDKP